jgi:hypothetical protein
MFVIYPFPWALEANYPAGPNPWNSTPTKVQPVGDTALPNTKPPAQVFNYLYNAWYLATLSAQQLALSGPLTNWCPEFKQNSLYTPLGLGWDPVTLLWLLLETGGPTTLVAASYGFDQGAAATWITLSGGGFSTSNTPLYGGVSRGPSVGDYWVVLTDNVGANNNYSLWWLPSGGSWTQQVGPFSSSGQFYGCEIINLGTYIIAAVSGTGATDCFLTWGNAPFNPISNPFQILTATPAPANSTWLLRSNGGQVVAIQSALDNYTVYSTTPAALAANRAAPWTQSTSLAGLLAAGNTVVGLCWTQDLVGPCWLAACQSQAGGAPFFFRSADGVNWTNQQGGMTTPATIVDMMAVGPMITATLQDSALHGPSSTIFSVDGGITWYSQGVVLTSNVNPIGQNRARIYASQTGFFYANGVWARFSGVCGLPTFPL